MLLNPSASFIWTNQLASDLAVRYAGEFGISLDQANHDAVEAIQGWEQWTPPVIVPPLLEVSLEPAEKKLTLQLNNVKLQVHFLTKAVAEEVLPRVSDLQVPDSQPNHKFVLSDDADGTSIVLDGVLLATERLVTSARTILLQEMTKLAVPGRDFSAVLHAAAVGNADGCVILAGASFSGKSTLCAALMQAQFFCYSEDSASLTKDYQLAGMPFAISLREGSWPLFPHLHRPRFIPSNLNGTSPTVLPVGLVFVKYDSNQEVTVLEPIDAFQALLEIEKSGFWVEHSESAIGGFIEWLGHLPRYRLSYSDLNSAVGAVTRLLENHK